jgi:hypothetical protein
MKIVSQKSQAIRRVQKEIQWKFILNLFLNISDYLKLNELFVELQKEVKRNEKEIKKKL